MQGVRRGSRAKRISQKVGVVSETEQQQAVADHLAALENDTATARGAANDSDEEFQLPADSDGEEEVKFGHSTAKRKKSQKSGGKRKTRGMVASQERGRAGARTFETLLDQAYLDELPPEVPTYLTAAAGPPTTASPRKFCSVCGNIAGYKCIRCAARFCSRKCYGIHNETRCLKFMS